MVKLIGTHSTTTLGDAILTIDGSSLSSIDQTAVLVVIVALVAFVKTKYIVSGSRSSILSSIVSILIVVLVFPGKIVANQPVAT